MTDGSPPDRGPLLGRRERKKLATRHALSSAALQLAVERGLENVTIEDITARADVALRTFRNYFASKYEAMCALAVDRARNIGASLVERPASEPLWEALINAVLQHYQGTEQAFDQERMTAIKLVAGSPAIQGEYLKIHAEMQDALAAAIAERTGTDPGTDMYPQILAGAVTAATQVAIRRWYRADPPEPLLPLIELALRKLAAACSGPSSRPGRPALLAELLGASPSRAACVRSHGKAPRWLDRTRVSFTISFTESYALAMSEGELRPTPRYITILAAANDLARGMNHDYVGVEHLFLAIIRDRDAVPTQVLATAVDPRDVEARLRNLMGSASYNTSANRLFPGPVTDE